MEGRWNGRTWAVLAGLGLALAVLAGVGSWAWWGRGPDALAEFDVVYGRVGKEWLRLDVFRPGRAWPGSRPAVVLIHGGGWVGGDKSEHRDLAEHLARAGFVTFSVGYRLARDDQFHHPAQVDDVQRAVRWVRAHARDYGIDPKRLGAVGYSAGGHLAACLGTMDTRDNSDPALAGYSSRVECVVDCSGPTDFTDESSPPVGPRIAAVLPALFGPRTGQALIDARRDASPVAHVDARSAPTLIVHGTEDDIVPVDQARRLFVRLREAGVEARLVEFEGEGHGFLDPENNRTWVGSMLAFLRAHLKP